MTDITGTLLMTLHDGSALYSCDAAGSLTTGVMRDGSPRRAAYAAGSLMLVDPRGTTIIGPVDANAALDIAIGVAVGNSQALTAPQAIHILAIAYLGALNDLRQKERL